MNAEVVKLDCKPIVHPKSSKASVEAADCSVSEECLPEREKGEREKERERDPRIAVLVKSAFPLRAPVALSPIVSSSKTCHAPASTSVSDSPEAYDVCAESVPMLSGAFGRVGPPTAWWRGSETERQRETHRERDRQTDLSGCSGQRRRRRVQCRRSTSDPPWSRCRHREVQRQRETHRDRERQRETDRQTWSRCRQQRRRRGA